MVFGGTTWKNSNGKTVGSLVIRFILSPRVRRSKSCRLQKKKHRKTLYILLSYIKHIRIEANCLFNCHFCKSQRIENSIVNCKVCVIFRLFFCREMQTFAKSKVREPFECFELSPSDSFPKFFPTAAFSSLEHLLTMT